MNSQSDSLIKELPTEENPNIEESPYQCDKCNKSFNSRKNIKRHMKVHSDDIQYSRNHKCQVCNRTYKRSDHLARHMISHSENPKPFSCEICISRFSNRSHLNRHIRLHRKTNSIDPRFHCDQCGVEFPKRSKLRSHMKQHGAFVDEPKHDCLYPYCSKSFKSKEKLDSHVLNTHDIVNCSKKVIICPVKDCSKAYSTRYNLRVHIAHKHSRQKNDSVFICSVSDCRAEFLYKSSLKRHIEKHSNCSTETPRNSLPEEDQMIQLPEMEYNYIQDSRELSCLV